MGRLPDLELSYRDSCDFIFDSALARKALTNPVPLNLAVFLREIIRSIYKLSLSCHLAEFTNHGLSHLCSLDDRISTWTTEKSTSRSKRIVDQVEFSPTEASILLLAVLFHDIGMLSQHEEDLPLSCQEDSLYSYTDVAGWVRATHIKRIERLIIRLFRETEFENTVHNEIVQRAIRVAKAHGAWPWQWDEYNFVEKDDLLAAILAVVDLLDEDSERCDSLTLIKHRYGTELNYAHWIRHGLTSERIIVDRGEITIHFQRPPNTGSKLDVVFNALRNHYHLILLYKEKLSRINAEIRKIIFVPNIRESNNLNGWQEVSGFCNENALQYHLLGSFMPEALFDKKRIMESSISYLASVGITEINLNDYYKIRGTRVPRTTIEQSFRAILEP